MLLDSHTITTVGNASEQILWSRPNEGVGFLYIFVVCGELCGVWRMSAPFLVP